MALGASLGSVGYIAAKAGLTALRVGQYFVTLAVLTSPWNALVFQGLPIADLLFAAGFIILGVDVLLLRDFFGIPWWLVAAAVGLTFSYLVSVYFPLSDGFYAARFVELNPEQVFAGVRVEPNSDLSNFTKWLAGVVVVPVSVMWASRCRSSALRHILLAWLLGSELSCAAAVSDYLGFTHLSGSLIPLVDSAGRQAGLTVQPVHLGLAAALTSPVAAWNFFEGRRVVGVVALSVAAVGIFVSGSRGALFGIVLAVSLTYLVFGGLEIQKLVYRAGLILVTIVLGAVFFGEAPSTAAIARGGRSQQLVAQSDASRSAVANQALQDFYYQPLQGVGFRVLTEAHSLYLQVLASGGLLLACVLALGLVGMMKSAWTEALRGNSIAAVSVVSITCWLVLGIIQNQINDVYLYVPVGIVVAIEQGSRSTNSAKVKTA